MGTDINIDELIEDYLKIAPEKRLLNDNETKFFATCLVNGIKENSILLAKSRNEKDVKWQSPCPTGHNQRSRYTHGFRCYDCGAWVARGTIEHFREEDIDTIWASVHNYCCNLSRENVIVPDDLHNAKKDLYEISRNHKYFTDDELVSAIKSYIPIFEKYGINANDAIVSIDMF